MCLDKFCFMSSIMNFCVNQPIPTELCQIIDRNTKLIWKKAISSAISVSFGPFGLLFWLPLANCIYSDLISNCLLAYGAGCLLGDTLLHLIPHAMECSNPTSPPCYLWQVCSREKKQLYDIKVGTLIFIGFMLFLCFDRLITTFSSNCSVGKEHENNIKTTSFLNLMATFLHNFMDGLVIGSAYITGEQIGFAAAVTVLLHEIPHGINDMAILVQSGYSRINAMLLQLITTTGTLVGTSVPFLTSYTFTSMSHCYIIPIIAGGFLFITCASIIPKLFLVRKVGTMKMMAQLIAMCTGVATIAQLPN